jgi:hypothetical protein
MRWGGFALGVATGLGAALAATMSSRSTRPIAKKMVRAGVEGYIATRASVMRWAEDVEDMVAEVMHEMGETEPPTPPPVAAKGRKGKDKGNVAAE